MRITLSIDNRIILESTGEPKQAKKHFTSRIGTLITNWPNESTATFSLTITNEGNDNGAN